MRALILLLFFMVSCGKNGVEINETEHLEVLHYDTTAVDSFAPGATPANMLVKKQHIKDSTSSAKKELEEKIKALETTKDSKNQ